MQIDLCHAFMWWIKSKYVHMLTRDACYQPCQRFFSGNGVRGSPRNESRFESSTSRRVHRYSPVVVHRKQLKARCKASSETWPHLSSRLLKHERYRMMTEWCITMPYDPSEIDSGFLQQLNRLFSECAHVRANDHDCLPSTLVETFI